MPNPTETQEILKTYAQEVSNLYKTGVTTEHSFRGSLQTLLNSLLPQYSAVNEPQRSACGAPDYALVGKKDRQPHAYVEAKDLFDNDLRGANVKGHKEQFDRYKQALSRVAFTDYLDFRFFVDGVETAAVSLLKPNAKGGFDIADGEQFVSILTQWADCSIQPINSARRLAEIMAYKARLLRESIEKALGGAVSNRTNEVDGFCAVENRTSYVEDIHGQFEAFKNILLSDLTPAGFADLYAQTIAYGMFAARLNDPQGGEASRLTNGAGRATSHFSRQEAATLIPFSNPFLRKIFQQIAVFDLDSRIAWIVDDLVEAFAATDVSKIMGRYQQNSLHQDPLIHFYEDFLAAYDPKLRKACGVYYTPQPVVSFIVRAIDEVLIRDFGLADGLADDSKFTRKVKEQQGKRMVNETLHRVQILDPATGTGTFLAEAVRQIYRRFEGNEGLWPQYVEESLRPRLHGFELLMAPYTITHLKLDMMLRNSSAESNKRLRVYLTNSLEECHPDTGTLFAQWLSNESAEANAIKRDCPVMVMMGNPPYSISSSNSGEWITNLVEDYKRNLNERNIQSLSDDYIKFIRLGQHYIERNGTGVLGFITNNSYLDGIVHRQMRKTLLETFDDIYIANLHGNSKRKETAPDGSKDENVFDIMVGANIAIFVKTGKKGKKELGELHYIDLFGTRTAKYDSLDSYSLTSAPWQLLECKAPNYFFVPKDFGLEDEYSKGIKIDNLFNISSNGIESGRDDFFVAYDIDISRARIKDVFEDRTLLTTEYGIKETPSCRIISNFDKSHYSEDKVIPINYRPFDSRFIYYDNNLLRRGFEKVMKHMIIGNNVGLLIGRQGQACGDNQWNLIFCSNEITDRNLYYRGGSVLFPLYLYDSLGERHLNMKTELIGDRKPEEFFAYIYAVLHSPSYRERYKEFLKIDFPRIPQPTDETEYHRLVTLGQQLIDLHLMRASLPLASLPKYPVPGTNTVDAPHFADGRVYINDQQYFDGVSETAWTFFIGGYQPAQKWLKDRRTRTLTLNDIRHYQRMIATLDKTAEIMAEIG